MQIVRESIVLSSIRSFFNALFALIGVIIGLVLLFSLSFMGSRSTTAIPSPNVVIVPDAHGQSKALPESAPVIMKIDIHNIIGLETLKEEFLQNILTFAEQKPYAQRIKGIILSINSPGGTVFDSNAIYEMLQAFKASHNIPIYAHIKGLCASGGYYIACATDKIYATPVSIIGSVGVKLGPSFNYYDVMQKVGIKALTLTNGKDKEIIPSFSPLDEPEGQKPPSYNCLIDILHSQYMRFINIVTTSRKRLDANKLEKEYGAQVYIAKKAQELGYIDVADSTFNQALTGLVKKAKITDSYQVLEFSYRPNILDSLITSKFCSTILAPFNFFDKFMPVEAKLKDSFLHLAEVESLAAK
jgi:protease IV